jgi:hypothetical protein
MSEAKTLNLTIGERVKALAILDGFKGSLATLATLLEDVKNFAISEEEWTAANLVKTPQADGTVTWKWDDTGEKPIEAQAATITFLKDEIKKKSDANEITLADVSLISLDKKLQEA